MGLDIWFAEDIRNALLAANEASAATAALIAEMGGSPSTVRQARGSGQAVTDSTELLAVSLRAYREGYKAALTTVALAFGIAPQAIALRQAQDKALQVESQDEILQCGGGEVAYLSPGGRGS